MAYTVTLYFSNNTTKTYTILKDGYRFNACVGAEGKHCTQSVNVTIRSKEAVALFLKEESKHIKATVKEGSTVIFEGVVRPYQSVSAYGDKVNNFSFEVMDYTEILHVAYKEDKQTSISLKALVARLLSHVNLTLTMETDSLFSDKTINLFASKEDEYVDEILSTLLFEYGYDYVFSPGKIRLVTTTFSGTTSNNITSIIGNVSVVRSDDFQDGLKVTYPESKTQKDTCIYTCNTRYDKHWSQFVSVEDHSGLFYDQAMHDNESTVPEGSGIVSFNFGNLSEDATVVGLSNLRAVASIIDEDDVSVTGHVSSIDNEKCKLWVNYSGTFNYIFGTGWGFDVKVYADVEYLTEGNVELLTKDGKKKESATLKYVNQKTEAENYINREFNRQKTKGTKFTFKSNVKYTPGAYYKFKDETVLSVESILRILSCTDDGDGIYSISAETANKIELTASIEDIYKGDVQEEYAPSSFYLVSSLEDNRIFKGQSITITLMSDITSKGSIDCRWKLNGSIVKTNAYACTLSYISFQKGINKVVFDIIYSNSVLRTCSIDIERVVTDDEIIREYAYGVDNIHAPSSGWMSLDAFLNSVDNKTKASNSDFVLGDSSIILRNTSNGSSALWMRYRTTDKEDWSYSCLANDDAGGAASIIGSIEEYALVKDAAYVDESTEWMAIDDLKWFYGYIFYKRVKNLYSNGVVGYSIPKLEQEMTDKYIDALYFELSATKESIDYNRRLSGKSQNVAILYSCSDSYKNPRFSISSSLGLIFTAVSGGFSTSISYLNQNDVTFTVRLTYDYAGNDKYIEKNLTIPCVETYKNARYLGTSTKEAPSVADLGIDAESFIEGDIFTYINGDMRTARIYINGSWTDYNESLGYYDIFLNGIDDMLDGNNHKERNGLDVFGTVFSKKIVSDKLFTNGLESLKYEESTDGYPSKGFQLKENTIKAYDMKAVGGVFKEVRIEDGKIVIKKGSDSILETYETTEDAFSFNGGINISGYYFKINDFLKYYKSNVAVTSGKYKGKTVICAIYCDELDGCTDKGLMIDESFSMWWWNDWGAGNYGGDKSLLAPTAGTLYLKLYDTNADSEAVEVYKTPLNGSETAISSGKFKDKGYSETITLNKGDKIRLHFNEVGNWGNYHKDFTAQFTPSVYKDYGFYQNGLNIKISDTERYNLGTNGEEELDCSAGDYLGNCPCFNRIGSFSGISEQTKTYIGNKTSGTVTISGYDKAYNDTSEGSGMSVSSVSFSSNGSKITQMVFNTASGKAVMLQVGAGVKSFSYSIANTASDIIGLKTKGIYADNLIGMIAFSTLTTARPGWLRCQGITIPDTYSKLKALIGATTPNIPDYNSAHAYIFGGAE